MLIKGISLLVEQINHGNDFRNYVLEYLPTTTVSNVHLNGNGTNFLDPDVLAQHHVSNEPESVLLDGPVSPINANGYMNVIENIADDS